MAIDRFDMRRAIKHGPERIIEQALYLLSFGFGALVRFFMVFNVFLCKQKSVFPGILPVPVVLCVVNRWP